MRPEVLSRHNQSAMHLWGNAFLHSTQTRWQLMCRVFSPSDNSRNVPSNWLEYSFLEFLDDFSGSFGVFGIDFQQSTFHSVWIVYQSDEGLLTEASFPVDVCFPTEPRMNNIGESLGNTTTRQLRADLLHHAISMASDKKRVYWIDEVHGLVIAERKGRKLHCRKVANPRSANQLTTGIFIGNETASQSEKNGTDKGKASLQQ